MIGVAAHASELETAKEFFELFKTPWEVAAPGRHYRVVVSTVGRPVAVESDVLIAYGTTEFAIDQEAGSAPTRTGGPILANWDGLSFPLYNGVAQFAASGAATVEARGQALDYRTRLRSGDLWRIGYDLFGEVRHLLTEGQPAVHARTPTLELHIALLRQLLIQSNVPFVEVTPRPTACDFICCLTHDVDFFGIRRHAFDRTLAGFVARSSIGTLVDFMRGQRPLVEALRNWSALLKLPLIFLRILPDFWRPIEDYLAADGKRPSTFFVVPFRNRSGIAPDGNVQSARAVKYQASDVAGELKKAAAQGKELAVHGIDAWNNADTGREELRQITTITKRPTAGVRMHWLYFDRRSAAQLEAAGFSYDSTLGYNDAVGYRAGTSQVFRMAETDGLLELPLTIMDSALFYPDRMGLGRKEALVVCREILANAHRYGGTVVINWHERSLAPERQWGDTYRRLLEALDAARPWFATAAEAVEWFRWRRSIKFEIENSSGEVSVRISAPAAADRGATVRCFRPKAADGRGVRESDFDGRDPQLFSFPLPVAKGQ